MWYVSVCWKRTPVHIESNTNFLIVEKGHLYTIESKGKSWRVGPIRDQCVKRTLRISLLSRMSLARLSKHWGSQYSDKVEERILMHHRPMRARAQERGGGRGGGDRGPHWWGDLQKDSMTDLKDDEVESEEALEALATPHDLPLGSIAFVIFILLCLVSGVLKKRTVTQNSQCVQLHFFTVEFHTWSY